MTKKDSQEGNNPTEQTIDDAFINEFTRISQEHILRQYEEKNRKRISEASLIVRDTFDKLWTKVTGRGYYQPVTTAAVMPAMHGQNNTERTDPRSLNYREIVNFNRIGWQKLPRRKIGKRYVDLFSLKGVESVTGEERPIYQNVNPERLKEILGIEIRDQLMLESKSHDHGEVDGDFNISVEGYWEVIFAPQSSPNDPKNVELLWEGQCLLLQRMKAVILPGFFIEAADNALLDHYTQEPGQGRKKVGTIQRWPYTTLRRATRQEYLAMKSEGDRIQREAILREENG